MTMEEIKEFVAQTVKEQKDMCMPHLRDRVLHPSAPKILAVTMPPHIQTPHIDYYRGDGDLVEHIQRHETSLLDRTNDDNHFVLLFPGTLGDVTSHWFFGLSKASVRS